MYRFGVNVEGKSRVISTGLHSRVISTFSHVDMEDSDCLYD